MNNSTAVMQRRKEPADSLDYFPTPPWGTRILCERVIEPIGVVHEPACGEGDMSKPLSEYFDTVISSDVYDYGYGDVSDYLTSDTDDVDWTITNPPFKLAEEFISKALTHSRLGVAMILRLSFLESIGRYNRLFNVTPPTTVAVFSERIPMIKGRLDANVGTASSYAWFVWKKGDAGTQLTWLPPMRKHYEKQEDYKTE